MILSKKTISIMPISMTTLNIMTENKTPFRIINLRIADSNNTLPDETQYYNTHYGNLNFLIFMCMSNLVHFPLWR